MSQELIQAVMVLTKQKGFAPEVIFESLEAALLQAYRKEPTSNPDAYVVIDRETGVYKVMAKKQVVETVELPETEISLLDARKKDKRFEIGDVVEVDVTPVSYTHLDVYKRQELTAFVTFTLCCCKIEITCLLSTPNSLALSLIHI